MIIGPLWLSPINISPLSISYFWGRHSKALQFFSIYNIDTKCTLIQFQDMFFFTSNQNMNHRARDESHLSWVVPLGCLRDVVHEVELARRCFGHLPARGELAKHLVLGPADVVALLPLVVELQRLVCLMLLGNGKGLSKGCGAGVRPRVVACWVWT